MRGGEHVIVWHDAELDPPGKADGWQQVLIVKENKSGERVICFGAYLWETKTWSTNNGKGIVRYWMPMPKMPER